MAAPTRQLKSARDQFLEQITNIDCEFNNWEAWQLLMNWVKRQPWCKDFLGGDKIPSRLLHHATLANEVSKYLGGPVD